MSLLSDFLKDFYSPGNHFQSVHAKIRHEEQSPLHPSAHNPPIGKRKQPDTPPILAVDHLELWAIPPDFGRADLTKQQDGQTVTETELFAAGRRFKRNARGTVEYTEPTPRRSRSSRFAGPSGEDLPTDYRRHFEPLLIRQFLNALELQEIGPCQIAGRDCVRIHATLLPGGRLWSNWLPNAADEYEFAADLAIPSLLSIKGLYSGQVIESWEVTEIHWNQPLDQSLFNGKLLAEQMRQVAFPELEHVSPEAAALKVPFKILLPIDPTTGAPLPLMMMFERWEGTSGSFNVRVHKPGSHSIWFYLHSAAEAADRSDLEWEHVHRAGRDFQLSDPQIEGGQRILIFEQAGTHVEIASELPREDLLDFALTFRPFHP